MESNQSNSAFAAVARIFWMFLGPGILFLLAYNIAQKNEGWVTPFSIAFLVILVLVIAARQVDPFDSYGEPRLPGVVWGFTFGAIVVGLLLWGIVHMI
jgi:hypothetical protein